jgi:phage terminase large subunit
VVADPLPEGGRPHDLLVQEQVKDILWAEIRGHLSRSRVDYPQPNQTSLRLGPDRYIKGVSTNESVRIQGYHSNQVLIIVDEAADPEGIDASIWDAINSARSGGNVHVLALGNPTISSGPFYEFFKQPGWSKVTIDAFDTPNFDGLTLQELLALPPGLPESDPIFAHKPRPYVTNRRWVYEVLHEYGVESAYWEARVRGQFPTEAEDALISLAWIEAAQRNLGSSIRRDHQGNVIDLGRDKLFVGADVAGPGRDETVIVVRNEQGQVVDTFACHGDSRGPVAQFLMPYKPRIVEMNCDEIGVGLYWTPHFEELGYPAEGINVGRTANDEDRFANLKAEYYWRLRENFRDGQIGGIVDPIMASQLASIRYRPNAKGKIEIESKDDLKKRGVKSPDRAEP